MPKVSDMRESKFLKKEDVGTGTICTVEGCEQQNVAKDGVEPELRWCLIFAETDKPLVLNSTNIQLCEQICGSDDTDDWIGKKIVLYADPTVAFKGKIVGGIRVRAPKIKAKPVPVAPVRVKLPREREPGDDDEITADDIF